MKTQTKHSLMLMLCAFIWGTAFVAQSAGSGMGAYSFLAGRSWLAVLVLIPTVFAFDAVRKKQGQPYGWPKEKSERKTLLAAGLVCGTFLFAASAAQQIGITINPSTAKAAFLTAMYVVLVPVFGLFFRRRVSLPVWIAVALSVGALYLLCIKGGFSLAPGDLLVLVCAICFSVHILVIDHFTATCDGVKLSCLQFLFAGTWSTILALFFDTISFQVLLDCIWPLLYVGVFSCGVGYTLQIIAQKDGDPTVVSLLLSLESFFAVVCGAIVLHERISLREYFGCALMLAAVILSQLPEKSAKAVESGKKE